MNAEAVASHYGVHDQLAGARAVRRVDVALALASAILTALGLRAMRLGLPVRLLSRPVATFRMLFLGLAVGAMPSARLLIVCLARWVSKASLR